MKMEKSYILSLEEKKKVEDSLAQMKDQYALIEDIVLESQFDAGAFFEHELEDDHNG